MWLGHLARMSDNRIPKLALFGWLPQPRPRCGPRRRWRDVIRKDLKVIEIDEREWYTEATSRGGWKAVCRTGLENHAETLAAARTTVETRQVPIECEICSRTFRRESDKMRHKCRDERLKPICDQRGAAQCGMCKKWFRSKGGMAVHSCRPDPPQT